MNIDYRLLDSTSPSFAFLRLLDQYKKHDQLIIAYDIDDTVRPYSCSSCAVVKDLIRMAKKFLNCYFIVTTCNPNIEKFKKYLEDEGLPYDAINENAPFVNYESNKIYCNLMLDDKAGLNQSIQALQDLMDYVMREKSVIYQKQKEEEQNDNRNAND